MKVFIRRTNSMVAGFQPTGANTAPDSIPLISYMGKGPTLPVLDLAGPIAAWPAPSLLVKGTGLAAPGIRVISPSSGDISFQVLSSQVTMALSPSPVIGDSVDNFSALGQTNSPEFQRWPIATADQPFRYLTGMLFDDGRLIPAQMIVKDPDSSFRESSSQVTSLLSSDTWGYAQTTQFLYPGSTGYGVKAMTPIAQPMVAFNDSVLASWTNMQIFGATDEYHVLDILFDSANRSNTAASDAYIVVPIPAGPICSYSSVVTPLENYIGVNGAGSAWYTADNAQYAGALLAVAIPLAALIASSSPVTTAVDETTVNTPMYVSSEPTSSTTKLRVNYAATVVASAGPLREVVLPGKNLNFPANNFA